MASAGIQDNLLFPYEKDIQNLSTSILSMQEEVKMEPQTKKKTVRKIDELLQEMHSYIIQLQIDHKSMAPSQKKKDVKTKLTEYNAKYHQLNIKQKHI